MTPWWWPTLAFYLSPWRVDRFLLSLLYKHKKQALFFTIRCLKQGIYGCSTNSPLWQIWVLYSWNDLTYLGVLCLRIIDSSSRLFISLAFHEKRESLYTIELGASGCQPPSLHPQGDFFKVVHRQRPGRRCKKPPLVVTQSKNRRWE